MTNRNPEGEPREQRDVEPPTDPPPANDPAAEERSIEEKEVESERQNEGPPLEPARGGLLQRLRSLFRG